MVEINPKRNVEVLSSGELLGSSSGARGDANDMTDSGRNLVGEMQKVNAFDSGG